MEKLEIEVNDDSSNDELLENSEDMEMISSLIEEEIPEEKPEKEEKVAPVETPKKSKKEEKSFEQISIFDIDDDE